MFTTSESTELLDQALAKAQSTIEEAELNCKNPYFNSTYADLTSVWRACRKSLTENGISVTQWPVHSDDGRLHLLTRLAKEGQWLRCEFSTPVAKQDAQSYGSATTYLKRFALCAAIGVVGEADDDGNAATKSNHVTVQPKPSEPPEFKAAREARERNEADQAKYFNKDTASNDGNKPGVYQASKIAAVVAKEREVKNYAPGAENDPPMPDTVPDWVTEVAAPSPNGGVDYTQDHLDNYTIPFGKKFYGKRIKDVPLNELTSYLDWLIKQNAGKSLSVDASKFRDMVNLAVQTGRN